MSEPRYPIITTLRLDWSELDMFGHINNVFYFKYLQASRIAYWEKLGLDATSGMSGIGPMLASTKCDFKKPLHYPGSIAVHASITELGHTSFHISHRITDDGGNLCAEGSDVVVLFDYTAGSKVAIPEDLRNKVEALEGRPF